MYSVSGFIHSFGGSFAIVFLMFFLQFIDLSSVFVWLLNQFHLVAVYWLVVEIEIHLCVTYGLVWLPALEQAISSFSLGSTPLQTRWLFVLLLSCWSFNVTVLVLVCLFVCFVCLLVFLIWSSFLTIKDWLIYRVILFSFFFVCLFVCLFCMFSIL